MNKNSADVEEQEDLRADIMSAIKQVESIPPEEEVEQKNLELELEQKQEEPEQKQEEPDPEQKREEANPDEGKAGVEASHPQDQAPTSWSKEGKEAWKAIPDHIRKEILRREEASIRGVEKLKQQYAPLEELGNGLAPFIKEAVQGGVHPVSYISQVMQTERILRTADNKTKFQEILRICDQYGVPLRQIVNMSVGEQVLGAAPAPTAPAPVQLPPQVMQELEESRRFRQSITQEQANSEISRFAADPKNEFFEQVREEMATLIERGVCSTLESAYEKAVFMRDDIREEVIRRRIEGERSKELASRRTAAVNASPTASNKTGAPTKAEEGDGSVADDIRNSILQLSGRV